MDAADYAQERELDYQADRLEQQRRAAALDVPGNKLCADCTEEIPAARRLALPSAIRCIECQAFAERVGRALSHA